MIRSLISVRIIQYGCKRFDWSLHFITQIQFYLFVYLSFNRVASAMAMHDMTQHLFIFIFILSNILSSLGAFEKVCPGFNCYIETMQNERILDCNYRSLVTEDMHYRLIKCEYDYKRKAVFLTPVMAADNFVHRISKNIFKNILSLGLEIEEVSISHIKIDNISRSDFMYLRKLKGLTLINPGTIQEDSFVDIANPDFFQLYIYCYQDKKEYSGFSSLRIPSKSWRIIIRNCIYAYGCTLGSCINGVELNSEYYIKLQPINNSTDSEIVIRSATCLRRRNHCPTTTTTTTTPSTTNYHSTITTTSSRPYSNTNNNPWKHLKNTKTDGEKITRPLLSDNHNSKTRTIIIVVVVFNLLIIAFVIAVLVWRFRQKRNRRPCRGKHTIVLDTNY